MLSLRSVHTANGLLRQRESTPLPSPQVYFNKDHDHTVLRLTWEGNFRKKSCTNCCARWWITIDGSPCSNYEEITTSISSSSAYDIFAPTTISGICYQSAGLPIFAGNHTIKLEVGPCSGSRISNAGSGFFSSSRLIVDELPTRKHLSLKSI